MPLPLFFIGAAVATSVIGGEKTIQAAMDNSNAKKINMIANDNIESARTQLERQRQETGLSLDQLGKIKLEVLDHDVLDFVTTFEKIKNIDFQSSIGLDELKDLHIDQNTFTELKELGNFALEVAGGVSAGAVGGAMTAIGAYGAATTFASASTGTRHIYIERNCRKKCDSCILWRRIPCLRWSWNGRRNDGPRRTCGRSCLNGHGFNHKR